MNKMNARDLAAIDELIRPTPLGAYQVTQSMVLFEGEKPQAYVKRGSLIGESDLGRLITAYYNRKLFFVPA